MLTAIPRSWNADIGPALVRTLNLERNNITAISDGDFFGLKIERLILAHNFLRRLEFLAFWGLEYNLQTLDLGHNRFDQLPSDALRLLQNLRSLTLTGNRITSLRDFDFGYMRKLEVLALDSNPLVSLGLKTFSGNRLFILSLARDHLKTGLNGIDTVDMKQLKGLSLAHNKIHNVGERWFENMKNLWYLNMADNHVSHLPRNDTFVGLERSLINLDLSGNRFHEVPISAVRRLRRMETLDLSRNRIGQLDDDLRNFSSLVTLQTLNFSSNRIRSISAKAFHGVAGQIRVIDLRNNRLPTLDEMTFHQLSTGGFVSNPLSATVEVYLSGNRWLCNCLLKWLRQHLKQQQQQRQLLEKQDEHPVQQRHIQNNHQLQQLQKEKMQKEKQLQQTPFTNRRLVFPDGDVMHCDRPHYLAGLSLTKAAARDYTCENDYYYYYEERAVNSVDDEDRNYDGSGTAEE